VEQYRHVFDEFAARVRTLLAVTDNLSTLQDASPELLANEDTLDTLRYLAGPPISADDLKTLSGASLAPSRLRDDPAATKRILDTVLASLDTKRFPWIDDHRHPDSAELRVAAIASASLMATQRVQTDRRGQTVPSAVLSGVFKRHNVVQAQEAGLTIFWAHDLQPLGDFILTAR